MRRWYLLTLSLALASPLAAADRYQIYGRVVTSEGETLKGPIRWDQNEASWFDILDGSKKLSEMNRRAAERHGLDTGRKKRTLEIFGIKLFEIDDERFPSSAQSGIRFGHIRTLERRGSSALLHLRSGEEIILGSSADIGSGVSEVLVVDQEQGKVRLRWRDIESVELLPSESTGAEDVFGKRLYGTVLTESHGGFQGFVGWDQDELYGKDVLDGKEEGRDREIPFSDVLSIERGGDRFSLLSLRDGGQLRLSGSNDVNSSNRGIQVADPGLGEVLIEWEDFVKFVIEDPPPDLPVEMDGGRFLEGTVITDEGHQYSGRIRWDNDEEYTWEFLNGEDRGIGFKIELGLVKSIERKSSSAAIVELLDGRTFELHGSNDVDRSNKGIFIRGPEGSESLVEWNQFRRVEFKR